MTISGLIDKQDGFEIVRDKISAILAAETISQQALAVTAGKDPALWELRVFEERSNPWEEFKGGDLSPVVNVWYDNSDFSGRKGDPVKEQLAEGIFNIDCYGSVPSGTDGAAGHLAGDRQTVLEAQRAARLVRNILMAGTYAYLDLRGTVGARWPQAVTSFQPQIDGRPVQHVSAVRFALRVTYSETGPQQDAETLETVAVDIKRAEDGSVVAQFQVDYPL